jgi:hypothetical protein
MPKRSTRTLLYTILPTVFIFGGIELFLRIQHFEGTSIAELESTEGIPENMYLHRRDRVLGPWFIQDPEYKNLKRSNPWRVGRGFHNQKISTGSATRQRVFALGGSTTYGTPYEHERLGFVEKTQASLNSQDSDGWEIINMGVAGMDVQGFGPIVSEITTLGPDAFIIYTGNNEIRGALLEECTSPYREGIQRHINQLRLIQLLQDQYRRYKKISIKPNEIVQQQSDCMNQALNHSLNSKLIPKPFPLRQDPLYWTAVERFSQGMRLTLKSALNKNITVYLVIPAIHLMAPPELSVPDPLLSSENRVLFDTLLQTAQSSNNMEDWQAAYKLDPTHAFVNYQIGIRLIANSEITTAVRHLESAVERDYLSKRITPTLQKELRNMCSEFPEVKCIDMDKAFREHSPNGIPGSELFVDFCHPNQTQGIPLITKSLTKAILESPPAKK